MINKTVVKFSLGFLIVIAFSFAVLVFIGYYKIADTTINTASNNKELEVVPR